MGRSTVSGCAQHVPATGAMAATRREEAYSDLVALAWIQARHPQAALPSVGNSGRRLIPAGRSGAFVQPNEIFRITADDNCSTLLTADKRRPRSGGRF